MLGQQTDRTSELGRLVALAERLASEGQMNLNKLVEAAIYAKVRQSGWSYRPQVTVASMQQEFEASLQDLKRDTLAPELIVALEIGWRVLTEQHSADLLIEEAPDVFVCRSCGHAALGSPPDRCPGCRSRSGRFRKFVAFFNGDNSEPIDPMKVLLLLAHNTDELERLVHGLSEEQLNQAVEGSDWSIRDHIAHIYVTQQILDTRINLMLEHDNPELRALAFNEFANEPGRHPASVYSMLAEFRGKRMKCIARLESLPLKDLWRPGRHPEFGQLTILRQAAELAYHEQSHLSEIEALCNQAAGERR